LTVNLKPGEERFYEIKPNRELILGQAISSGFGVAMAGHGVYGLGAGGPGTLSNCESYFSIVPVGRGYALKELANIRESKQ